MHRHALRHPCDLPRAISALLLLTPSSAAALTTFHWIQPSESAPVEEFRIYAGPPSSYEGELVWAGLPAPGGDQVYSADVQIDEIDTGDPVYVWLTAVNEYGESDPSNANFYPQDCVLEFDSDCDGVFDDGAQGDVPCVTGQTSGCDDNCPYTGNPDQLDTAGLGGGSPPDGIGDACQCGDVSGDGQISSVDASIIMRALMQPPLATLERPELCDVGGSFEIGRAHV